MTCPKCNSQNSEETLVCQNCKESLHGRKFNFWKIGFVIELFFIVLLVVLISALTSDNMDLKLRVSTAVPQISQPSSTPTSTPTVYPQIASWKTYTNPELGITFQYPSDWEIDDSYGSLLVKHMSGNCEILDPITCQYYGFYIEPWNLMGEQVNTEDPALYLLENLLREEKRVGECTVRTGTFCQGEISIPGWPAYKGRDYGLIEIFGDSRQTLFPAVEISTMPRASGDLQYLVVSNKRFYLIELAAPGLVSSADLIRASARMDGGTENNHPIIQIVRSLRFL